jgi:hypothetical protein
VPGCGLGVESHGERSWVHAPSSRRIGMMPTVEGHIIRVGGVGINGSIRKTASGEERFQSRWKSGRLPIDSNIFAAPVKRGIDVFAHVDVDSALPPRVHAVEHQVLAG